MAGDSQTDTVTVTGDDAAGTVVTATDQATVTLTTSLPVDRRDARRPTR